MLGGLVIGILMGAAAAGAVGAFVVSRRVRSITELERDVERAEARAADATDVAGQVRAALDAIALAVVIADEDGAVRFRNTAARGIAGSRHADAIVEQAINEMLVTVTGRHGSTPDPRTLDLFGPPRRTVVVSVAPPATGAGAVAFVEDITERTRLEAVRTDFVTNISHELKSPVGALALLAETLLAEDDPDVSRRLAERIVIESHRVGRTIDDLLELSRIEIEQAPVREAVPVHLVVAEAVERMRPAAELRHIAIDAPEPSNRLKVIGDRRQLVSALGNLLDNAIKYSDQGATVAVRSAHDGRMVDISVADHGIGIPARDLERIFERFYRVDRARSRETGGTGLGLAIVRHVATNHHGEVRVTSAEGEGSTFTLRLPAGPGPVALTSSTEVTEAG